MVQKRGVYIALSLIVALALVYSVTNFLPSDSLFENSGNLITGAAVGSGDDLGVQKITGQCNVSITESVFNLGHDYFCSGDTYGFSIDNDNVTFDCQNHTINCQGNCNDSDAVGIKIVNQSGVIIQNCRVFNFTVGIQASNSTSELLFNSNFLQNNTQAIMFDNVTLSNITANEVLDSSICGINLTNSNIASSDNYNNIWNNIIANNTNNACAGTTDYSYWSLSKNCASTNIIGGPCLGGNYWGDYSGWDSTGDALGDNLVPHKGGAITTVDPFGDLNPLVALNGSCPLLWSVSTNLNQNFTSAANSGECFALVGNDMVLDCQGNRLTGIGNGADDERGIEIVNRNNITVQNCDITGFKYGIYVQNANNITLYNNTIWDNNLSGIYVDQADGLNISTNVVYGSNNMTQQDYGVWLRSARPGVNPGNTIISNTIYNNTNYGVYLSASSDYNTITSNTIYSNAVGGIVANDSDALGIINNVVYNNTRGIWLINSISNSDFGTRASSTQNTVYNHVYGFYFENSKASASLGAVAYNNQYGIYYDNSEPNIFNVSLYSNSVAGLVINNTNPITNVQLGELEIYNSTYGILVENSRHVIFLEDYTQEIYNNTYGLYLGGVNNSNFTVDSDFGSTMIRNNSYNVYLLNSNNNVINETKSFGGKFGIFLDNSDSNTITNNNFSFYSNVSVNFSVSNSNLFYNNFIDNSSGGSQNVFDDGTNDYNVSNITIADKTNIIGGNYFGGNFWSNNTGVDTTGDGLADTTFSIGGGSNIDNYPLVTPLVSCGEISTSFTLIRDINATGDCLVVTANDLVLDFANFVLRTNGGGIGINLTGRSGVTIKNANVENFTQAIFLSGSSNNVINNTNFTSNGVAINFTATSNNNNVSTNNLTLNTLGIGILSSTSNLIYDNFFNNTNNAKDDGSVNDWNSSYVFSGSNILGGNATGGNFWDNYLGKDTGGSSSPNNETDDSVGDTSLPFTNSNLITGGDYLPLTNDNGSASISCQTVNSDTILSSSVTCASGNGITITADNVILDCNGNSITGAGNAAGISINSKSGVVIKDCDISNFYYGIKAEHSSDLQIIEDNNVTGNDFYGIYLYNATNVKIDANVINNDNNGVYTVSSSGVNVTSNTINLHRKFYGVYGFNSDSFVIYNNTMWNNYHGIYFVNVTGSNLSSNQVNISDIYSIFLHKESDNTLVDSNILYKASQGLRIRQSSSNISIYDNNITDNSAYGIYATDSDNHNIFRNIIRSNVKNFYFSNSENSGIENNTIENATLNAVLVSGSNNNLFKNNTFNSTSILSLEINDSDDINLTGNMIFRNASIYNSDDLIFNELNNVGGSLEVSSSNNLFVDSNVIGEFIITTTTSSNVTNNTLDQLNVNTFTSGRINSNTVVNQNDTGFNLSGVSSSSIFSNDIQNTTLAIILRSSSNTNTIYDNWIKDNAIGLNITSSTGNSIYNNYFSNTKNVDDDGSNTWNTDYSCNIPNIVGGPCKGGNFYSNYYGLDNGASSREQGDGVGDQPSSYSVVSGTTDTLPLVLFVARQYFKPNSLSESVANSMIVSGNISGVLDDEEVVPNTVQEINFTSGSKRYVEVIALFNQSNFVGDNLRINFTQNITRINRTAITGFDTNYSLFVYHGDRIDNGVYLCLDVYNLTLANGSCANQINFTSTGISDGVTLSVTDSYYKLDNITSNVAVMVQNESAGVCGSNIMHDVTLSSDVACSVGDGMIITKDNITIDFAGYTLTGNGSNIGINISNKEGVVIKNANIDNFSIGIYVDPSSLINISDSNISNSSNGVVLLDSYNSTIFGNRIINNTYGINLTNSSNNTIYNNYFNNTNNSVERSSTNMWNGTYGCSGQANIIGGSCIGGNFWHDYDGWDLDNDGVGDTLFPYNNSNNISVGDVIPLLAAGRINCGSTIQDVNNNITLRSNVGTGDVAVCFNFGANKLTFDMNGYKLTGNNSNIAFNLSSKSNITIINGVVENFSKGVFVNGTSYELNLTNLNISNNSIGVDLINTNNSEIFSNYFLQNTIGINLNGSANNLIYNNYFNNTNNSIDNGSANIWNVSYICNGSSNILGESCMGGNFWHDYNGSDNGSGVTPFNTTPWTTSSDGIGDTLIPYNVSGLITSGDQLPLMVVVSSSSSSSGSGSSSSSSGGSGGGGGGSGGGGSSSVAVLEDCSMSWTCTSYSECLNGQERRNCNDLNNCLNRQAAGQVGDIVSSPKPVEVRSCVSEVVDIPGPSSGFDFGDVGDIIPEPVKEPGLVQTITIASLTSLFALGAVLTYWQLAYAPTRLRRKLRKVRPLLDIESADLLKGSYMSIYKLYMKLSEGHKRNFYTKVTKLREKVEVQLKVEKKMQRLFTQKNEGSLGERKKNYLHIYDSYRKLPSKVQKQYYSQIVKLRDELQTKK